MKDTSACTPAPTIAGFPSVTVEIAGVRLCTVPRLEDLVDRDALLRGDAEPPYWAWLWSGARMLAANLAHGGDLRGRRVLEIGCGLGLPGLAAAARGAEVTFVDAEPAALAFVSASAAANGLTCATRVADFFTLDVTPRFDLVLAAEVAYDRARFAELAAVVVRHLAPGGTALLADGYRTDTRGLYRALGRLDCAVHAVDVRVVEEGRPIPLRISAVRRRGSLRPPA